MLSCFMLQGLFGYLLLERLLKKKSLAVIGSVIFILSPIMLFRLGGHSALGAHWLLLWSLFLVLEPYGNIRIGQWTAILLLCLLIHPYLFFMCGAVFVADLLRRVCIINTISLKRASVFFTLEVAAALVMSFLVGIFSVGGGAAPGYGVFSLDLNGLINPYGFSTIIQNMQVREPNEGFNYLGLGVILLCILSLFEYARQCDRGKLRDIARAWWPLFGVCIILVLVAITNVVSAWGRVVFRVPLPAYLHDHVFGIVRSSGRLFWPVYYLIVLWSFSVLKRVRTPLIYALLIGTLCLQVYDMKDKLRELDQFYQNITWESPLKNPFWAEAAKKYEHISFVPTFAYGKYEPIALFAAQHAMTLNTGYVVRNAGRVNEREMKQEAVQMAAGVVDGKTLYIFLDEKDMRQRTASVDKAHEKKMVDGYAVLAP